MQPTAKPAVASGEKTASATIKTGVGYLRSVNFVAAAGTDEITLRDGTTDVATPILARFVGSANFEFPGFGVPFATGLRLVVEAGTPTAINVYFN